MSNQIELLQSDDIIAPNTIFFVGVIFNSVPFAHPSTDSILAARQNSDETVLDILDVKSDVGIIDKYTLKCNIRPVVEDLTAAEADSYIMNILQYMSENIVRVFGIQITQTYFTTDSNFPDSSSTLYGSTDISNPTNSDITNQANDALKNIGDTLKKALPTSTTIIIILIIVAVIVLVIAKKG